MVVQYGFAETDTAWLREPEDEPTLLYSQFCGFFFFFKWLVCSSISEKVTQTCDSNRDISERGKAVAATFLGQKLLTA